MEVWALYAYGASHVLQEIMTVKSDDVTGRVKVYEALVKGKPISTAGVPESFRVLIKEFQALGLNIEMIDYDDKVHDLRELEADEDDGDALTIDEIDINTGEVKGKPSEEETPVEEEKDEFDNEEEEFENEPSIDDIMALENGFEGGEE